MQTEEKKLIEDFNKAAKKYAQNATIQLQVAKLVANEVQKKIDKKNKILDVGCGTGFLAEILKNNSITQLDISPEMCKKAEKFGEVVVGDMHALPFPDNYFDKIISSLAIQWSKDLKLVFNEIFRTLKPKGSFIFSTFSNGTLKELKNLFHNNGLPSKVNDFHDEVELRDLLLKTGFKKVKIKNHIFKTYYTDLFLLLKSIRKIGAANKRQNRKETINRKILTKIADEYNKVFSEYENIYASWHVSIFSCTK